MPVNSQAVAPRRRPRRGVVVPLVDSRTHERTSDTLVTAAAFVTERHRDLCRVQPRLRTACLRALRSEAACLRAWRAASGLKV